MDPLDIPELQVRALSVYMSIVTYAGLAYIANFTLPTQGGSRFAQDKRLLWEDDEKLGRVPIICGETTKTDQDSDARWVASPSVEPVIHALSIIAHLRMTCDSVNPAIRPSPADQKAPYLWSTATEPWGLSIGHAQPYEMRRPLADFRYSIKRYSLLFDQEQLRIRSEDLNIALRLTPNLPANEFAVGKIWPLSWHQYRRTGAVNMFASGDISDSTIQQQMKHNSRLMPIYYGRNHSRLHFNDEVRAIVVRAMYESQAEIVKYAINDDRFVSPHSHERKDALAVNVLSAKDSKTLVALARKGTIAFREHRLGGCMKGGVCEYGGFESVARCAGGDGRKPCADVLFDRTKEPTVRADLRRLTEEIKCYDQNNRDTGLLLRNAMQWRTI